MKYVKMGLVVVLLLLFGYLYNHFSIDSEENHFSLVELKYPNDMISVTIKRVPASICMNKAEETAEEGLKGCAPCQVLRKECMSELPDEFIGIYENQQIAYPYVAVNVKYPERHIGLNMPEGVFEQLCEHMKQQYSDTLCIR